MFKQRTKSFLILTLSLLIMVQMMIVPVLGAESYTVIPGDTFWKISVKLQVSLDALIKANPQVKDPAMIVPGQVLVIPSTGTSSGISWEQQVLELTNAERKKANLAPLKLNTELSRVARIKSEDMRDNNYFSHTSPKYGSPFTMMKNFGISYTAAGENIAAGYKSPSEVVNAWMASPGHRQNILNPNFTQLGVGYAAGGNYRHYWTQMFIRS